ncbi:DDE-type integrase/transposase/recombinase [Solirhodobacter olei]|uniref:DDE-type integrase/transposase/recombinase n=1 Tax=Solirhodobacter olei TaxID=2493082 RepID=UPI000FD7F78D|nr:DDE-type integrase/transposase/recombinase [Solirhodobacter olei]
MQRFGSTSPLTLAEGTRIVLNGRTGLVYRSTARDVELVWDEWSDADTGEVHAAISDLLSAEEVGKQLGAGRLCILELPGHLAQPRTAVPAAEAPRPKELQRASWRECYVLAAHQLLEDGTLAPRRASFVEHREAIIGLGLQEDMRRAAAKAKGRAGQPIQVSRAPKSGEVIYRWWRSWCKLGESALIDSYRHSGNRSARLTKDSESLVREVVDMRLHEERPSIASILESAQARVRLENRLRKQKDPDAELVPVPGYDTVWRMIAQMAPIDHAVRTQGMDDAYKQLHTLGQGLKISRPLERVEIDEYTVDLQTFLRLTKLDQFLTPGEKIALGLTGKPQRLIISAAIDVYTGAIVALQITTEGNNLNATLRTIEMIYLPKDDFVEASGAAKPWPMSGHPQTIAFDRGSVYLSDEMYLRLSVAGITNLAVPAGKPFLKPWIERFFRTFEQMLLNRFIGRTFSNVVLKGDNDAEARATLSLDDFLFWMTRWIVDVYHTHQPETLGRSAPLIMWERAVAEMPPVVMADEHHLRRAFGDRYLRKLTRAGVEVSRLHYQCRELEDWFLNHADQTVEVWWWHKKIGRVDVRLPNDTWVTAHCTDEQWADASYDDLAIYLAARRAERQEDQDVRDAAIVEMDRDTERRGKLRGLLPLAPTPEEMAKRTKEFRRYTYVPGERPEHPAGDIFDDVVAPFDAGAAQIARQSHPDTNAEPTAPSIPDTGHAQEQPGMERDILE